MVEKSNIMVLVQEKFLALIMLGMFLTIIEIIRISWASD